MPCSASVNILLYRTKGPPRYQLFTSQNFRCSKLSIQLGPSWDLAVMIAGSIKLYFFVVVCRQQKYSEWEGGMQVRAIIVSKREILCFLWPSLSIFMKYLQCTVYCAAFIFNSRLYSVSWSARVQKLYCAFLQRDDPLEYYDNNDNNNNNKYNFTLYSEVTSDLEKIKFHQIDRHSKALVWWL